jgi:hypothetical protein
MISTGHRLVWYPIGEIIILLLKPINLALNLLLWSIARFMCVFYLDSKLKMTMGSSWPWLYGSFIYNYLCNQCLSTLTLWIWIPLRRGVLNTILCDKVCQWLASGWWFSLGILVSSTNKTDRHDITEILLKVVLNTITLP